MRNVFLIFVLILFSCRNEKAVLYKNVALYKDVESVKKYMVVPKTNPEYWTEPKGLMLMSEEFYDEQGRKIKSFCSNCDVASHSPSFDVVTNYYYDEQDLIRIHREGRDTIETDIKYFKDKKIKVEYVIDKGNCIGVNYARLNDSNKEIRRMNLDFSYFNELNDFHISYYIEDHQFTENVKVSNINRAQIGLDRGFLKEIVSADLSKLMAIEEEYYNKFMRYEKNYHANEIFSTYKDGKIVKEETRYFGYYKDRIDFVLYFYDSKGMLIKMKKHFGVFDGDYKCIYKYRK
jgi:hypothetical protein